jgi:nitrate reductase assembly molybdenum cofactor insertion protein NarJ
MNQNKFISYQLFAEAFKYPSDDFKIGVERIGRVLEQQYPASAVSFCRFAEWAAATPMDDIREVYMKTFHIQAICYLDLGYVIFGEDYKRGDFLVKMKQEQEKVGNDIGDELPDNLANVLSLIPKLEDSTLRDDLMIKIMIPALRSMTEEFKQARMELKIKALRKKHKAILQEDMPNGNVYLAALQALLKMIETDYQIKAEEIKRPELSPASQAFISSSSCNTCSTPIPKPVNTLSL